MTHVTNSSSSITPSIDASPTKRFFVEMLTRDIALEDAILDLLDNCIDGIQRLNQDKNLLSEQPYKKFWAKITLSSDAFKIEDNCGGIPLDVAQNYAFRMGRPDSIDADQELYTIGTYGIGMKRAIFKMGRSCEVISKTQNNHFKVTIYSDWLNQDADWNLPFNRINNDENNLEEGTSITISNLHSNIAESLQSSGFRNDLYNKIAKYYSFIIQKGFKVYVNKTLISAQKFQLLSEDIQDHKNDKISPYLYKLEKDEVTVKLAIGFYRPTTSDDELEEAILGKRRRSESAGWTIVCNDRVVVANDKTRLTGWGEVTVPSYHPQFIAIAGIVHFSSKDAKKLPITTTKRGIDSSSDLFLYVKSFMRDGIKKFTNYTNKWKQDLPQEKENIRRAKLIDPIQFLEEVPEQFWSKIRNRNHEKKYEPDLPLPQTVKKSKKNIRFSRTLQEIKIVSEYLFEDADRSASEVGNECFEVILKQTEEE